MKVAIEINCDEKYCYSNGLDCRFYSMTDIHNLGSCDYYDLWIQDKKRCQQCLDATIKE
jgi:hypothetical protein